MIKIFRGGRGGDTFKTSSPPTNNFCLYPPPILRCFWKDPLTTPPPHFKHLSLLSPLPIHHPFPPLKILIVHKRAFRKCILLPLPFSSFCKICRQTVKFCNLACPHSPLSRRLQYSTFLKTS